MEQKRITIENDITMEQMENVGNKEIQDFDTQLKGLIGQIKSIREIKMITDSEYDSIQQLNDKLAKKEKEIDNLNYEIKELKKDKRDKDDLNNQINELREDSERKKDRLSLYVWGTIWSILVVFSFCAIWLFMKTPWIEDPLRLIPLLTGGLLVLLIMAILLIVITKRIRQEVID